MVEGHEIPESVSTCEGMSRVSTSPPHCSSQMATATPPTGAVVPHGRAVHGRGTGDTEQGTPEGALSATQLAPPSAVASMKPALTPVVPTATQHGQHAKLRLGGRRQYHRRRRLVDAAEPPRRHGFPRGHLVCFDVSVRGTRKHELGWFNNRRDNRRGGHLAGPSCSVRIRGRLRTGVLVRPLWRSVVPVHLGLHGRQRHLCHRHHEWRDELDDGICIIG